MAAFARSGRSAEEGGEFLIPFVGEVLFRGDGVVDDTVAEVFQFALPFHVFVWGDQEDAFHGFAAGGGFDGFDTGGFDAVHVGAENMVALFEVAHVGIWRFSDALFAGFESDGAKGGKHGVACPDGFVPVVGDDGFQCAAGGAVAPAVGLEEADVFRSGFTGDAKQVREGEAQDAAGFEGAPCFFHEGVGLVRGDVFDDMFEKEGIDALVVPREGAGDVEDGHVEVHPALQAVFAAAELDVEGLPGCGFRVPGFVFLQGTGDRAEGQFVAGVGAVDVGEVFFGPVEPVEDEVGSVFDPVCAAAACSRAAVVPARMEMYGVVPVRMPAMEGGKRRCAVEGVDGAQSFRSAPVGGDGVV